ncbi:baseplate assembly protein V [Pectobacterium atrosepticum SCRI1043]|uniref:Baseplate assembly protein V n=1 Tax=Pectobacterium atrosepticum (strain SCRI 1043 / ATCC BAA-672) TaxID=218491 RepID=Q6D3Y2_PECAS|nr:phage baseplate assembly protein V [Pectobacterium atrosepticum]MCL6315399.1 phage baseplate assembly protein V [Pectobacterium atrosepticum]MCL6320365.1 phage baseplate assembly protein V [Pectobacterium atrosepticum]CAG75512.1 baseplate assembly protein V [Pectobacterium atrosepticum SCRI1043]
MTAELLRLLENVLRVGVVTEIDVDEWRVRVSAGGLHTDWLRWDALRAGSFSVWIPPSVGEQVLLGCIGGNPETAVIIGSIYSDENPAPGSSSSELVIKAPDGATVRYDAAAGALEASGMKTARIVASVGVTLETPVVECTEHLVAKTFSFTEGGTMKGDVNHTGGAFKSNGVQADEHSHGNVLNGPGWSDGTR